MEDSFYKELDGYSLEALFSKETNGGLEPMQFIGLYDINGREIYEGDIVSFWSTSYLNQLLYGEDNVLEPKIGTIVWNEELMKFEVEVEVEEFIPNFSKSYDDNQMEIVGNIYENPEYL